MSTAGLVRQRRAACGLRHCLVLLTGLATAASAADSVAGLGAPLQAYRQRMGAVQNEGAGDSPGQAAPPTATRPAVPATAPGRGVPLAVPAERRPGLAPRESLLTAPATATQPAPQEVLSEIPDPVDAPRLFQERLARLEQTAREPRVITSYRRTVQAALELLKLLELPQKVRLSLDDAIRRALRNNYVIRGESYNPAISETLIVEAEAAFDATFFLENTYAHQDPTTARANAAGQPGNPPQSDVRTVQGGLRKLLPTGLSASTSMRQQWTRSDITEKIATLNPAYDTAFIAELRQPLLRGFGLDYNRAPIEIARVDRRIAYEQFLIQVRDTLLNVETAYWGLLRARRDVAINAESVAHNFITWQNMIERQAHDATPVELANAESNYKRRYVLFQEAVKNVRDAEDALKNLLNDPELLLSREVEIIPTEVPLLAPVELDQFAEVRTALEQRNEVRQAQARIERSRIQTMQAKNQTLPQLDVSFLYQVDGSSEGSNRAFDQVVGGRFQSYTLGVSFSYPIGNRGPEAAYRRSRLQEAQSIVNLHRITDLVVQEVNNAVRQLIVRYSQIPPQLDAVRAAERNLRALQARTQRIDPSFLQTELTGVENLANTRSVLLQVVTDFNIGIVQLERAKGTLLRYYNVLVTDEPPRR